jgi:hypothetical protein
VPTVLAGCGALLRGSGGTQGGYWGANMVRRVGPSTILVQPQRVRKTGTDHDLVVMKPWSVPYFSNQEPNPQKAA